MKQTVEVIVPENANDACLKLRIALPTLVALGLQVVCEAARENNLTVATTTPGFFGPMVVNPMNLATMARALDQQVPVPDGPPTV